MSRGKDFRDRGERRRGFDDDNFSPSRDFGGGGGYAPMPRQFGGPSRAPAPASGPPVDAVVKWFNPEKGFGFVEIVGGGDAFLHIAVLGTAGYKTVAPGSKLSVRTAQGHKGMQVTEVLSVDESTATPQAPRSGGFGDRGGFGGGGGGYGARPPRPGRPDPSTAVEMSGTVKWYNPDKGFGFVSVGDGGKDVFVHASVLQQAGMRDLAEGQRVTMRVVEGMKGREAASISAS
jgi:CspA family cold shock protein